MKLMGKREMTCGLKSNPSREQNESVETRKMSIVWCLGNKMRFVVKLVSKKISNSFSWLRVVIRVTREYCNTLHLFSVYRDDNRIGSARIWLPYPNLKNTRKWIPKSDLMDFGSGSYIPEIRNICNEYRKPKYENRIPKTETQKSDI